MNILQLTLLELNPDAKINDRCGSSLSHSNLHANRLIIGVAF